MLAPIKHIMFFLKNSDYRKLPEDSVVVEKGLLEYWKDKATNQNGLLLNINGINGWFPKEFIVDAIETYKSMEDSIVLSKEECERLLKRHAELIYETEQLTHSVNCYYDKLKENENKIVHFVEQVKSLFVEEDEVRNEIDEIAKQFGVEIKE